MYAVIFKATMKETDPDYYETAGRLRELAKQYGCVDFQSVAEGKEEITISYWKDLGQIENWKADPVHGKAQQKGKEKWYESYCVEVVEILRKYENDD